MLVLLLTLGMTGASASASKAVVRWFHSPSRNIECEVAVKRTQLGTYAYGQTHKPPQRVTLYTSGRMRACRGVSCEGTGAVRAFTLRYRSSVGAGPFRCTSLLIGM